MVTAPRTAKPKGTSIIAVTGTVPDSQVAAEIAAPAMRETMQAEGALAHTAMETRMDQATRTADGMYKAAEEAMEFGRGNVEAFTKATQTYMTGMQELSKQAFAVMQSMSEQAMQNAKALSTVKSLKEATELQTTFAKAQMEKGMAEATKLNEAAFKLAELSSAPIAARLTLAMERLARPTTLN